MCEVNVHGVSSVKSAKRERYVPFCNCNIVENGSTEKKQPLRCGLNSDGVSSLGPKNLKVLAAESLKLQEKKNAVSSDKVSGVSKGNAPDGILSGFGTVIEKDFSNETAVQSVPLREMIRIQKDVSNKILKGAFQVELLDDLSCDDTIKVDMSEDLGSDIELESLDEQDTLTEETDSFLTGQLSPLVSVQSDSQVSCNSYHTANSIDTENEMSSDYDQEGDKDDTFYDAWGFLNSMNSFRNHTDEICTKVGDNNNLLKQGSDGFIPSSLHNTSIHDIYVEDADTGRGHMILNGSQQEPSKSLSFDELLEVAESLVQSSSSRSSNQSNCAVKSNGKKDNGLKKNGKQDAASDNENKEEEEAVITTVSAVDLTDLQCPETELVPFTQSRSDC